MKFFCLNLLTVLVNCHQKCFREKCLNELVYLKNHIHTLLCSRQTCSSHVRVLGENNSLCRKARGLANVSPVSHTGIFITVELLHMA